MSEPIETPELPRTEPPSELPAVEPPTAGFIVQLFLIPALIVGVVVMVYLLFGKIAGGQRSPEEFLADLRGSNEERRWWAARELASILPHDKDWQNNEAFARDLATELEAKLEQQKPSDKDIQYMSYLAVALGEFHSQLGIPALRRATRPGVDSQLRRTAIIGLASLTDRIGSFPDASALPELIDASEDDDAMIRKLAAFTMGAIGRPESLDTLERLLNDPDREVTYNAASSLARLGSTAGLDTTKEMLDTERLRQRFRHDNLTDSQQLAQLEAVPLSAIESLGQLIARTPGAKGDLPRDAIEALAKGGPPLVKTRAKELLIKLGPN